VGLSTDPAAAISFEEDQPTEDGKPGAQSSVPKKKVSLVDYFYLKVPSQF
jgi:hypothetical protein